MALCFFSIHRLPFTQPHRHRIIPNSTRYNRQVNLTRVSITNPNADGTKVFVMSDLHTDYPENMSWVKSLSQRSNSVVLVAGDVAETIHNFILTMSLLKDKFQHVFFVPGNHDLWLRRDNQTNWLSSLDKLDKLLDACDKLGVETKPTILNGLGIIPLYSWYHESFDEEKDITGYRIPSLGMVINFLSPSKDFLICLSRQEFGSTDLSYVEKL